MNNGLYTPEFWLRFRDDCFDIWTHSEHALTEFTMFLNTISSKLNMKTKIIFKENYSDHKINFLDTTIYLQDGKLEFDVYSKVTDSHLYLLPGSTHLKENIEKYLMGSPLGLEEFVLRRKPLIRGVKSTNNTLLTETTTVIKLNIISVRSSLSLERNHLNQQSVKGKTSYLLLPDSIQEFPI